MFLHLGGDTVIKEKDIIAIMDMDTSSVSKLTREYLKNAEKSNEVINVSFEDLPKSYVVCRENGKRKVYISPISSVTLLKRVNNSKFIK